MAISSGPTSPAPASATLERIKVILRRDLKLGPDAHIPDDMPFFGGDFDLDSLDLLLLLTSIEKEFGIKVPSEAVGQAVFKNVTTLTEYIQEHRTDSVKPAAADGAAGLEQSDPLDLLPHRPPFRFVSRLVNLIPGQSAEGVWVVSGKEEFFAGHFPGNPLVPGVLLAEALAQLSGLVGVGSAAPTQGKLAQVDVRFDHAVSPPAEIVLRSTLSRHMGQLQQFEVMASVGEMTVARGSLTLNLTPGNSS